jgi:hypothetical protein
MSAITINKSQNGCVQKMPKSNITERKTRQTELLSQNKHYMVASKSYGRASAAIINAGLGQVLRLSPNPRMSNMYSAALPSKAMLEKSSDEASGTLNQFSFEHDRDTITFDSRLNAMRESIGDLVRNGSIIASPDCPSPLLKIRVEDLV